MRSAMWRHCRKCGFVGLWFRFYEDCAQGYCWRVDICKQCAWRAGHGAIVEMLEKKA